MSRWRDLLRSAGLGRVAYQLWFRPLAQWQATRRLGGLRQRLRMQQGESAMVNAAATLPAPPAADPRPLHVYYLTGKRFWHQSAFCAWSLAHASGRAVSAHFIDDGSLPEVARDRLQALFPSAVHYRQSDCLARLHACLPAARFPHLHALWRSYPNIRKLIDPHLLGGDWKLVLDSDMLFFQRPDALLHWYDAPQQPLHMLDVADAYGYPQATLEALSGAPLPARVNVGVTGLDTRALDFVELEDWCRRLIDTHGRHYFLEQALIAAWVGRSGAHALPATDYRLLAQRADQPGAACLDHYVADAKPVYFCQAWQLCLARWSS